MNQRVWHEFIQEAKATRMTNIIISREGKRIAAHHFDDEQRRNVYSVSKSFTSAAVGIAAKEGLLSMEEYVVDCFPDSLPEKVSPYLESLKVKHLLTMTMGQDKAYLMSNTRPFLLEDDWVSYCLAQEFVTEPGTEFLYTNAGPYLAGVLVAKRAGCNLVDYLTPRLFAPLGIKRPTWECDPLGNIFGSSGLFLCTSEMVKFGQLYLQKGVYDGRRILSEEWIKMSQKPFLPVNDNNKFYGYGYSFWMGPHNAYRADGKYGHYIIIYEDKNAVVAINSESRQTDEIIRLMREVIYPAL